MSQHPIVFTRHKTYMLQTFSTQNKGKMIHKKFRNKYLLHLYLRKIYFEDIICIGVRFTICCIQYVEEKNARRLPNNATDMDCSVDLAESPERAVPIDFCDC